MLDIVLFKIHCILNKNFKYGYSNQTKSITGFWTDEQRNTHITSKELSDHLVSFYKSKDIESLLDLGCGNGNYVSHLLENGIKAYGIDRNPILINEKGNTNFGNQDLSKPIVKPSDYVQTFEVGEHIPKKYSKTFFENICKNAKKGIVMSWAVPGQGGDGHINELPRDIVIKEIEKRGFKLNQKESKKFRKCISYTSFKFLYLKYNLLVFDKVNS